MPSYLGMNGIAWFAPCHTHLASGGNIPLRWHDHMTIAMMFNQLGSLVLSIPKNLYSAGHTLRTSFFFQMGIFILNLERVLSGHLARVLSMG